MTILKFSSLIGYSQLNQSIPFLNEVGKIPITYIPPLTKSDVGLNNVDNTSDLNKPVSNTTLLLLNNKINLSHIGIANGIVPLNSNLKIDSTYLNLTKSDIELSNVDNTSDLNKPISNAVFSALITKVDKIDGKSLSTEDFTSEYKSRLDNLTTDKLTVNRQLQNATIAWNEDIDSWEYGTEDNLKVLGKVTIKINIDSDVKPSTIYFVDTTQNAITLTLNATPNPADEIEIYDLYGSFDINQLLIIGNGQYISETLTEISITDKFSYIKLIYLNVNYGWVIISSTLSGSDIMYKVNGNDPDETGNFQLDSESINAATIDHIHHYNDITDLNEQLDAKSNISHTHPYLQAIQVEDHIFTNTISLLTQGDLSASVAGQVMTLTATLPTTQSAQSVLTTQGIVESFIGTQLEWDNFVPVSGVKYIVYIHD